MKKILIILLIWLPLAGFGQTSKRLRTDTISARLASTDTIRNISPIVSTKPIKATLFKQGADSLATKLYIRYLLGLIAETDPIFSISVAFHIKATDTARWANGGSFPYTKTLIDNVIWTSDGNHDFDIGSSTPNQCPLHVIIRSQYETSLYSQYGWVNLGSPAAILGFSNTGVLFTQYAGTGGIQYSGNFHLEEWSLTSKHWVDSTVAANIGSNEFISNKAKWKDSTNIYLGSQINRASNYYGTDNIGIGNHIFTYNPMISAIHNIAIGDYAMYKNQDNYDCIGIGYNALKNSSSSIGSIAIGVNAISGSSGGYYNTAIGTSALANLNGGTANTAIGYQAAVATTYGDLNTVIGDEALSSNTIGNYNVAIGYIALQNNTTNDSSIAIGYSAGSGKNIGNRLYIGHAGDSTVCTIWANMRPNYKRIILNDYVGIHKYPICALDINGQIKQNDFHGNLTDGIPTTAELNYATGLTPSGVGAGFIGFVKDDNGSGLTYGIHSDGTTWDYWITTKSL